MDATNTAADRAANPTDCQQLNMFDGRLVVIVRNDLHRDESIRGLRMVADYLEQMEGGEG